MSISLIPKALSIMGVNVVPFSSYSHALSCVEGIIATGRRSFCVAINPEKVYRAQHDRALQVTLGQADIGVCDGIGVAIAAKLLHGKMLRRCTGADLFLELIGASALKGWKVFLLGASAESNEGAYLKLIEDYPGLQIVGRQDGFFEDSAAVIEQINASQADILFVGMGSPKQEFWIAEHRKAIDAPFCMGVGGTFDVISGKAQRAPKVFRKTGTEFFFRLMSDPRRWRRQLVLPLFVLAVLKTRFHLFRNNGRNGSLESP